MSTFYELGNVLYVRVKEIDTKGIILVSYSPRKYRLSSQFYGNCDRKMNGPKVGFIQYLFRDVNT